MYKQAIDEFNFKEPKNLEDWASISDSYMNERSNENYGKLDIRMRPWLNEELKNYIQRGEDAVREMNGLFTGEEINPKKMIEKIKVVEKIALESVSGITQYPEVDFEIDSDSKLKEFYKRKKQVYKGLTQMIMLPKINNKFKT